MDKSGIYGIFNLENGKVYIGSTTELIRRKTVHFSELKRNIHTNTYLQRSYNKHGIINFEFRVLEECQENMLLIREQAWMDYYKSNNRNFGYNLKEAGSRGKCSEETRKKLRESHLGQISANKGKPMSEEAKKKMSLAKLGTKISEKTKEKMRISHAGTKPSKECIEAATLAKLGKHRSEETKIKISIANKGRIFTDEWKQKIKDGLARRRLINKQVKHE